ncbi:hypothetical protein SDC9_149202 [bioreactor metagenome]|uniref:Uncharacterized protein n=1 Tax=bioreactor metagenome TaxID=1076179 RepID=A0A645ELJ0_9ZZZZ
MIKDYSMLYKNKIIISNTESKPIISKSVLLIKNDKTFIGSAKKRNPQGCYEKFLKLSKGDDKKKVLKKFSDKVCCIYQAEYARSDNDRIETYYFDAINIKKVEPEDPSVYFTLTFKNDKLSDGMFYGFGKDKKYHYEELGKVIVK